jgi:dihydrofolate reductase
MRDIWAFHRWVHTTRMHVTLFMAMSVNGMIASKDGSEDFLSDKHWKSFASLVEACGNFIVGRKTYEAVRQWDGGFGFDDFTQAHKIIISRDSHYPVADGYHTALSPAHALDIVKDAGLAKALVTGGGQINAAFMEAGFIDEVILNIEPVLIGQGLPLLSAADILQTLKLQDVKTLDGDIVQLRYLVKRP